jgi:CRP-like cAMP-binding protein
MNSLRNVELFKGISDESIDEMMKCFKAETRSFRKGDTIIVYSPELEYLCIQLSGKAHLYSIDSDGNDTLLEHYAENDIYGEVFTMPYGELGYVVEADTDCQVIFIRFSEITGRCAKACQHHTDITNNLFYLTAKKTQMLLLRINMISRKTVRQKLEAYLQYLEEKFGTKEFDTEMSLSQLARYLCVDRTSLMREFRLMREEGILENSGRRIKLLQ